MSTTLKAGARLYSAVCSAELIVIKAPDHELDITIGGMRPVAPGADRPAGGVVTDGYGGGIAVGKRYVNADHSVELLCTKAGEGVPAIDGLALELKTSKPLPASD